MLLTKDTHVKSLAGRRVEIETTRLFKIKKIEYFSQRFLESILQ